MTDLLSRLTAAIDQAEALAKAADERHPSPWRTEWQGQDYPLLDDNGDEVLSLTFAIATWEPEATEQRAECETSAADLMRANDPATVLRGLAEDRSILRRHAPCDDCPGHTVRMNCHRCDLPVYRRGYGELGCEWQLSVARRHGLEAT